MSTRSQRNPSETPSVTPASGRGPGVGAERPAEAGRGKRQAKPVLLFPADRRVIGVDEVGRGCLAGPVVAGAVWLREPVEGVADSKALSASRREAVLQDILVHGLGATGWADAREIDTVGIRIATHLAMERAVRALLARLEPGQDTGGECWIDGVDIPAGLAGDLPGRGWTLQCFVKGDARLAPVAAASILAKQTRDAWMQEQGTLHPVYGFAKHVGYGTQQHMDALAAHGPCALHRMSFAPVARSRR